MFKIMLIPKMPNYKWNHKEFAKDTHAPNTGGLKLQALIANLACETCKLFVWSPPLNTSIVTVEMSWTCYIPSQKVWRKKHS